MSDQKQENKQSQIVDSINAEFTESDTSEEESKSREDLKEPKEDTGVDLEPSMEQQSAVATGALPGEPGKGASAQGEPGKGASAQGEPGKGASAQGEPGKGASAQGEPGKGASAQEEPGKGASAQEEPGKGASAQEEPGKGASAQEEPGKGASAQEEPGKGASAQEEPGKGASAQEEPGKGASAQEEPGKGASAQEEPGKGASAQEEPGKGASAQEEPGKGASAQEEPGKGASAQAEPGKGALAQEVKQSVFMEEAAKQSVLSEPVRQSALPERTEHAVVENLWTLVGAAVIILIAIGIAMCANPLGGPQTLDSRSALQIFQGEFKRLQKYFPEQNDKLWLRSRKMLTNHLNKSHPDEPAMIILAAAQDAKRTLQCLGSGLAQTYAAALNSSWLLIHGPAQAQYDASTAKLNIDEELSEGFETENRAAVLNRLETLPPGSLLIFFKYCDHENAAYKNVALVFTVLLEDSSLEPDTPLPELEEKVRDFLWQQFVHSVRSNQEMDSDKLSGVWSRISHLVLPVLPVERIETGNCPFDHE